MKRLLILWAAALFVIPAPSAKADGPRIVNYVNFVRKNDYRKVDSEILLYEATCQEVRLTEKYGIPATFLLQYDALVSTPYVRLMKGLPPGCEVGAWLEMNRPHVEAAGNRLVITMSESSVDVPMKPVRPVRWALDISWASGAEVPFGKVSGKLARATFHGFDYSVRLGRGSFRPVPSGSSLRMLPASNEITILL